LQRISPPLPSAGTGCAGPARPPPFPRSRRAPRLRTAAKRISSKRPGLRRVDVLQRLDRPIGPRRGRSAVQSARLIEQTAASPPADLQLRPWPPARAPAAGRGAIRIRPSFNPSSSMGARWAYPENRRCPGPPRQPRATPLRVRGRRHRPRNVFFSPARSTRLPCGGRPATPLRRHRALAASFIHPQGRPAGRPASARRSAGLCRARRPFRPPAGVKSHKQDGGVALAPAGPPSKAVPGRRSRRPQQL